MTKQEWNKTVKAARRGSAEAFETIYEAKIKVILLYTNRLLRNSADAQDAAHEVVLCMYKNIGTLQSVEAFNVWLHKIILRTCFQYNKKEGRAPVAHAQPACEEPCETAVDSLPMAAAEQSESTRHMLQTLDSLAPRQRLVLIMYYYEDMSYKEIAAVLGITTSGVAANLLKAKDSMKKKLSDHKPEEALLGAALCKALDAEGDAALNGAANLAKGGASWVAVHSAAQQAAGSAAPSALATVLKFSVSMVLSAALLTGGAWVVSRWKAGPPVDAAILMTNGNPQVQEHVNPRLIKLEMRQSGEEIVGWKIEEKSGAQLTQGSGGEIGADTLMALPVGWYRATWSLQSRSGYKTTVYREFEIL